MRITDLLNVKSMDLSFSASSKDEALAKLVDLMDKNGNLTDKEIYLKGVLAREKEGSTGIGEGIAIPHAKTTAVNRPALAAAVCADGIEFDSLDGEKAKLFFLIAAPDTEDNVHLDVLSRLSTLLMNEEFAANLLKASSADEFLAIVDEAEEARYGKAEEKSAEEKGEDYYDILCVTACPTGIAHTYMAAESLENKAKEMGLKIKVETDGSGGVKNTLTKKEIAKCKGIIIAADKNVEMDRFDGKKVVMTKVADGIHKPEELINRILEGKAAVYHGSGANKGEDIGGKESFGRSIYKHLMSGVSHMLPFVIGGGILIALAFLFDNYELNPANFGSNLPFARFLKRTGDLAFGFMLPILSGYIAYSIADRPGLAVGFVGGALAQNGFNFYSDVAVSAGFLGALAAGFIAGYMMLGLKKLCSRFPKSLEGIKPVLIYPVLGIFGIGLVMYFGLNWPIAALNQLIEKGLNSMNTASVVVVGMVVAGMMAADMGGPINKAAYTFGAATLIVEGASVSSSIMAAVMIGGMVPPLAIALATTVFRNKFTKKEKKDGIVNYIMGLSFITEGAIPFAASDPARVLPSCIVGSAAAGALSAAFGCTIRAPHGGIFVIAVVENWWWYLFSLAVGAVIGMLLLGLLKKKVPAELR